MSGHRAPSSTVLVVAVAFTILLHVTTVHPAGATGGPSPRLLTGRWIFDASAKPVPPRKSKRGLQTSGLVFWKGILWSVGDQRSEFPGHLFRIDPKTAKLIATPLDIEVADGTDERPLFREFRALRNPDLEGLTVHPTRDDTLLVVMEDRRPWILEVRIVFPEKSTGGGASASCKARLARVTAIGFPAGLRPYRDDSNYCLEGIAASRARRCVYLAYERSRDELPRILRLSLDQIPHGDTVHPVELPIDFAAVPRRQDKSKARLNINGIDIVSIGKREYIVAVARDQERLLVIDPEDARVTHVVELDLRAPGEARMLWVSPEGVAVDNTSRKIRIVNDPDSVRGNYRLLGDQTATGNFANLAPLLFEVALDDVVEGITSR